MLNPKRRAACLLLLLAAFLPAEVRTLTILHVNDLHARLSPTSSGRGGFAYLAAAIRAERAGCVDCILLNAGDLAQGTPVSTIFHGLPVYEVANLLGFDVSTPGNHDFDYGWQQTQVFMKTARYPMVSVNIVDHEGKLFTGAGYKILEVNGLRVAVIGAMTDELSSLTTPNLLGEWHTVPVLPAVRKAVAEVRGKSDLIVLLAHITGEEEQAFLEQAPEIPVIVTGHLHEGIAAAQERDGRVLVRVRSDGEELGRLELKVDTEKKAPIEWKWKKIAVDSTRIAPAEDVALAAAKWESQVKERVDRPLAVSARAFDKPQVKALIERAMREKTGADFAFMNGGGVRDGLPKGQLLERHIWNVMPFDNRVVVGRFKGKQLPAVVLGGKQVDPERTYTLAVNDYTAANQNASGNLGVTGLQFPEERGLLRDLLLDWFRQQKTIE
jgi:2',3'-cyclic-nucleotide 2'-phosphodiesterase (5'-nucleotidase family)